jgi:hypothetical protein
MLIEQQIGMPFIIMQQQQPGGDMQAIMQSQQAWIIRQHISSPLVQVMVQPMSIMSILHMPMVPMLQQQQHMPLHMQAMEHMALGIIMHRFFIISAAVLSSHIIVHRMPPATFSIFMVQRGTIVPAMPMLPAIMPPVIPGIIMPDMPLIMGMLIMLGIMVPIVVPIMRSDIIVFPVFICLLGFPRPLAVGRGVSTSGRRWPLQRRSN